MDKFKKLIYIYLASLLLASSIPFEFIHHLLEEHDDEIHVCDYDVCVREISHECQLDHQIVTKKYTLSNSDDEAVNLSIEDIKLPKFHSNVDKHFFSFAVRGPPALV